MKKKIVIIAVAVSLITVCGANFVMNHTGESPLKKMILANMDAVAFADGGVDIKVPGGGISIGGGGKRCTCQSVSYSSYHQCKVPGFGGFLKGQCNKNNEDCDTQQNNQDCKK